MSQIIKLFKHSKVKIILLVTLISTVVISGTLGGIYFYLAESKINIGFEQQINDIHPQDMGVEEFIEDFEYMYNLMAANFPFFGCKERRLGFNWLDLKQVYLDRFQECENTAEFLNVLVDAITSLQNCHTYLVNPSFTATQRQWFVEDDRYPYYEIFCEEAVEANQYWIDIYNNVMYERDDWFFGVNRVNYDLLMVYDKGEYIVHDVWNTTDNYMIGYKVVSVGNVPVHTLIKNSYNITYLHHDFARDRSFVDFLRPLYLGFSVDFTFENSTGGFLNRTLTYDSAFAYDAVTWRGIYPDLPEVYTRKYINEKVGYLQIGGMYNPTPLYHTRIMNFYESIADYNHLIIDIRGNSGGSDRFWAQEIVEPLLKEKAKSPSYFAIHNDASYAHMMRKERGWYLRASKSRFDHLPLEAQSDDVKIYKTSRKYGPENTVDFAGKIAVLTDHKIFSSSESFSAFCKTTGFATLYGTNTGGDGIGDATYFILPNSKLIIRFSYLLGLFPNGDANDEVHTPPDVYYESAAGNWSELIDFTIKDITT
jgi:hypothetical protein